LRRCRAGIQVVDTRTHLSGSADLALVARHATLEAAPCGAPMVVFKTPPSLDDRPALVRLRWASLVNIVAEEEVVPELIQDAFTVDNLVAAGAELLADPQRTAAMRSRLARVAAELGPPGASARAAELVLSAVEAHP
jgi:lipid-A-disaccharide synthase